MKDNGTFIQAALGSHLMFSLNLRPDIDLMPGNYIILIDPIWNDSANLHKDFKKYWLTFMQLSRLKFSIFLKSQTLIV